MKRSVPSAQNKSKVATSHALTVKNQQTHSRSAQNVKAVNSLAMTALMKSESKRLRCSPSCRSCSPSLQRVPAPALTTDKWMRSPKMSILGKWADSFPKTAAGRLSSSLISIWMSLTNCLSKSTTSKFEQVRLRSYGHPLYAIHRRKTSCRRKPPITLSRVALTGPVTASIKNKLEA
jgi:hypothetical protein